MSAQEIDTLCVPACYCVGFMSVSVAVVLWSLLCIKAMLYIVKHLSLSGKYSIYCRAQPALQIPMVIPARTLNTWVGRFLGSTP